MRAWTLSPFVGGFALTVSGAYESLAPENLNMSFAYTLIGLHFFVTGFEKASPPGLVTLLEASRLTEVSLHTVKSWIKSKRLRYRLGVINGRPIRFVDPSHVRVLLQTRRPRKRARL